MSIMRHEEYYLLIFLKEKYHCVLDKERGKNIGDCQSKRCIFYKKNGKEVLNEVFQNFYLRFVGGSPQ